VDETTTHGERKKALILMCGVKLWRADPASVSARRIGKMMNMTHAAVLYHFGDIAGLKAAIAAEAVRLGDSVIVPQLIASRHPAAAALSVADRRRFLAGC
jgi:AcrR family transcriptional regulator